MTRTVVALYDDFASANAAVRELVDHGFSRNDVSLIANDYDQRYAPYVDADLHNRADVTPESSAAEGAGVGAGIGAVVGGLGGLLVGLGALAIPGIGPVIAAGPLAAALTGLAGAGAGAVAGGVAGGLLGALVDLGIPEETAGYYAEGIRRGGTMVTIRTNDAMTDQAVDILNRHDPVDINERATQWREAGWTGFNPQAEPYSHEGEPMHGMTHMEESRNFEGVPAEKPYGETTSYTGSEMDRGTTSGYNDFEAYEPVFRNHFQTSVMDTGYTYDQYLPAYRYGYDLATDERFGNYRTWDELEPEARRYWDERNPGTWDRFKMAVRRSWEEVKNAVS